MEEKIFQIAVCDDEKAHREHLINLVDQWHEKREIRCKVFAFGSGQALMETSEENFDLIFLDILMDGKDGMQVARFFRERGNQAKIVFITSCADFVFKGYEVEAFRYLMKPYRKEQIMEALEKCYDGIRSEDLAIRSGATVYNVNYRDIFYVEAQGRNSVIVLEHQKIHAAMGISDLEKQLPQDIFYRCQKSFIVNLRQIASVSRYEAALKNGIVIPVSRTRWAELRDKMIRYLSK